MGLPAVDLDDEQLIGPEEVDHVPIHPHIHCRFWKTMAPTEGEHLPLEIRPGVIQVEAVLDRQA